jgi:hypothetical protein
METIRQQVLIQYSTSMDINKNIILAVNLFTASLFFQQCSCKKTLGLDCAQAKYGFQLPVKAYPDKDSISIGDTVFFEINESTSFNDTQSGQIVDYSGAENLGSVLAFGNYDTSLKSWTNENPSNFNLVLINGYGNLVNQTNIDIQYRFFEKDKRYRFLIGVVPKKKGLFSLLFSNSNNTYRKSDKCTKASFNIIFEDTNQHYPLNPFYIPGTNPRGGDYYFVVK